MGGSAIFCGARSSHWNRSSDHSRFGGHKRSTAANGVRRGSLVRRSGTDGRKKPCLPGQNIQRLHNSFPSVVTFVKIIMARLAPSPAASSRYQQILGIRFFVGDAPEAVEIGARGGLVVVPAAPALLELERDTDYRQALLDADLAITDSGLLW